MGRKFQSNNLITFISDVLYTIAQNLVNNFFLLFAKQWKTYLNKKLNFFQLNQQSQAKGTGPQDLSFLKEASPIYVASLTNNHVTGTTTLTTTPATPIAANCITGSNNQNNNQNLTQHQLEQRAFTAQNKIAANNLKEKGLQQQLLLQAASLLTATTTTSPPSIITTTTTTNNQQFNNLNNNNIISNNCGAGGNTLNFYYGNNTNTEVIANGHGPRREVRFLIFLFFAWF